MKTIEKPSGIVKEPSAWNRIQRFADQDIFSVRPYPTCMTDNRVAAHASRRVGVMTFNRALSSTCRSPTSN
jgi:hypothetical protein